MARGRSAGRGARRSAAARLAAVQQAVGGRMVGSGGRSGDWRLWGSRLEFRLARSRNRGFSLLVRYVKATCSKSWVVMGCRRKSP